MDPQQLKDVKRALGRRLAAWRKTRGLIQDDVARLVNSTRSTVAGVERGEQVVDRVFWVQCESLLQAGGELIAGYDEYRSFEIRHREEKADAALHARWGTVLDHQTITEASSPSRLPDPDRLLPTTGASTGDSVLVQDPGEAYVGARQAIMIAARETSKHAMDAGARAVSDLTIEQLRDDAIGIARGFGQLTPAATINEALRVRGLAVEALERTRRPGQQHELYLITAQAAALLASAAADLGLWSPAMQYARAADTYGEIIGHHGVRAYARGMQATIAYWTGRYEEAVRYAAAAVDIAPPGVAHVRAQYVLARAWAHRGAVNEVRAALTSADDARSQDGNDVLHDVIGGEFGFTASQQARCASTAWLRVNKPEEATTAATQALRLAATPRGMPWSTVEGEARIDLAMCHLSTRQLDAAQDTLTPLWSTPPEWRRTGLLGRLDRMQELLTTDPWYQVPQARQLAERAESFVAARPTPPALPTG
ncbi:helix-turn-helix domain-containing protein [Salinispora pacifica]|uniref:helix-turn-helix domain-containing protein n=1 Tax=Salinispora pacifica TaxID=351187 RepID=UPI00047F44DB|nr:helix-turn-helix domain-containing protein [Salinispora pacifica]